MAEIAASVGSANATSANVANSVTIVDISISTIDTALASATSGLFATSVAYVASFPMTKSTFPSAQWSWLHDFLFK